MSYTFFTREQVADVLTRIGNEELATRYLNNTTRRVVVTENPVKNSFGWRSTPEGFEFWHAISNAFDSALASGKVAVVGKTISEKKAMTILEQDVKHNPLDFLKKEFAAQAAGSSDDEAAEFIKKLLGISEEEGVDSDDDEDDEDDFDDMPTPSSNTSSEQFAEEMAQYVVREAIKRSLIKSKK